MTIAERIAKVTELKELERMAEELAAEIEAAKDAIKAEMGDDELMVVGPYKVTWKTVSSSRLDTAALKKAFPESTLAPFMRTSSSRRFCVN